MSPEQQLGDSIFPAEELTRCLRTVEVFAALSDDELLWLEEHMTVMHFEPGDIVASEGSPSDRLMVILKGSISARKELGSADGRTYTASAGHVTGMLPFSRLVVAPLTSRAMTRSVIAFLPTSQFPAMFEHIPALQARLVHVMADRIRETTRSDQQREKLMALGKLSAGLAHELNNPASALTSAAAGLKEAARSLADSQTRLDQTNLSAEARAHIAQLECNWRPAAGGALSALERSDREEAIAAWLSGRNVPGAWTLAASLVDSGCDLALLLPLSEQFDSDLLQTVLNRLAARSNLDRLIDEVKNGSTRISGLVSAIKNYSYMDQAPEQEIDVHEGLESTLVMLNYRLDGGIRVVRDYDRHVPKVAGNGSELNQVWTNLIDNAADAMAGAGELVLRTASEYGRVLVEVRDSGNGIPENIRDRIFEPFFTTKGQGEGIGLGLDIVYRIVRKHRGEVRVESHPGRTSFNVRIPAAKTVTAAF
ncbi:MAG: ATP-binding protein [Bryobacteraceae bacterium]